MQFEGTGRKEATEKKKKRLAKKPKFVSKIYTHTNTLKRVKSRIGITKVKCHVLAVSVSIHGMFNVPPYAYCLLM